jgi:hypothetical protein
MNTPAGAKPLRRADLRALIAHLGRTERHARMKWSHLRTSGQLSALADGRSLVFQHPDPEQLGGGLPEEGEQTTVLFRVRGVSFRCDGQVRRLERSRRRLMIQPELIEWTVTGIRLPESRYCRRQARIGVRAPTRRLPWIEVLAVSEEEIYAVNWPRSKALARGQELQAVLEIQGQRGPDLQLRVEAHSSIFPGCNGQILRATLLEPRDRIAAMLSALDPRPDRRVIED